MKKIVISNQVGALVTVIGRRTVNNIVFFLYFQLLVGEEGARSVLFELESMAARQQQEITQQRRLLEQRETQLAMLREAQVRSSKL